MPLMVRGNLIARERQPMTQDEFDKNDDPESPGGFFHVTHEWLEGGDLEGIDEAEKEGFSIRPLLHRFTLGGRNASDQTEPPTNRAE